VSPVAGPRGHPAAAELELDAHALPDLVGGMAVGPSPPAGLRGPDRSRMYSFPDPICAWETGLVREVLPAAEVLARVKGTCRSQRAYRAGGGPGREHLTASLVEASL
jgi:hypothetical protein